MATTVTHNTRRCPDCGNKFTMRTDRDDQCPRCARQDAGAFPRNIDPTRARPGELGYFNFRHGRQSTALFHRGGGRR